MKSSAPKVVVVCYGNPLRGDDGVGMAVAQLLEKSVDPSVAAVIYSHQLVPELAEPLSAADVAFFVDAREGAEPHGHIESREITAKLDIVESFGHECDPAALLVYAESLYGRAPKRCSLYTVCGRAFSYGTAISPQVRERIPELVRMLIHRIESEAKEPPHA